MSGHPLRVLGARRLSRADDASTSPERQTGVIERWGAVHEAEIVALPLDLGVSGSVSPFDREELGPWLTDNPPEPWDVLLAWRLDRISRSAKDTLVLLEWLQERGKRLVTVDDGLDSKSSMGRAFVQLAGVFAELERNTIQERVADGRAALKAAGRWGGEAVRYGYKAVPLEDGGFRLEVDNETAPVVRRIFDETVQHVSAEEIARRLQAEGVPTSRERQRELRGRKLKGGEWSGGSVLSMVRNRAYVGTPDEPGIIDAVTFERAQAELRSRARAKTRNPRNDSAPLSGVALCWECLEPLWHRAQHVKAGQGRQKTEKTYRYYYCRSKGHTMQIRADEAESRALEIFADEFGHKPVIEEVEIPDTVASDLALTRFELEGVSEALKDAPAADRAELRARRTELEARQDELESRPTRGPEIKRIETGRTWGPWISELDDGGRRDAWFTHKFRFAIGKPSKYEFRIRAASNVAQLKGEPLTDVEDFNRKRFAQAGDQR